MTTIALTTLTGAGASVVTLFAIMLLAFIIVTQK